MMLSRRGGAFEARRAQSAFFKPLPRGASAGHSVCDRALGCRLVRAIRQRIHAELQRRVRTVLRSGAWPEVAETLQFGLLGALVQASCGADTFRRTAEDLSRVVAVVLPDHH